MGMWRYQSLGEEFGPVPTDILVELVRSGVIESADLVCREGGPWQPARDFPELQAALSSHIQPEAQDPELLQLLNQVGGSPRSPTSSRSASSPTPAARQWFAEILGQELGPLDWEALTVMVGRGELSPTDRVRRGPAGAWQRADEIVGLFPESVVSPSSLAAESPRSTAVEEATWFVEEEGRPRGPYSYQTLRSLAAAGRLGPRDRIREGATGPWLRAAALPGLFAELTESRSLSGRAERTDRPDGAASTDPRQESNVGNPAEETAAEGSAAGSTENAPARDEWDEFFETVEARERRKWRREPAAVARPPAAVTSPPSPAPVAAPAAAPPPSPLAEPRSPPIVAATAPPPTVTAPAATAPPAAKTPEFVAPPRPKRSLSLPSLNLSGLFANLKGAAGGGLGLKLLIPLLIVAGLAAWQFFPGLFTGTPGKEFYEPIDQIWKQILQLHLRQAPPEEWEALASRSKPLLDEAQQKLAPIVARQGIKAPLAQRLLWMVDTEDGPTRGKGYLRKALDSGGRLEGADITTGNALMSEAASFLPR